MTHPLFILSLFFFIRLQFGLGSPPGSASKGGTFQIVKDACDWPTETGKDGPAGGLADRQGRSLHHCRMQHFHLHLGAGQPQRRQKREEDSQMCSMNWNSSCKSNPLEPITY